MTRAALALLLFATTAHAGDSVQRVQMADLVPEVWLVSVFEVSCLELFDCCGWHRDCGDWWQGPDVQPAPIPLPPAGLMLTAALAALIWKGSRRV